MAFSPALLLFDYHDYIHDRIRNSNRLINIDWMKIRKENRWGGEVKYLYRVYFKNNKCEVTREYIYVNIKDNVTENTVRNILFSIFHISVFWYSRPQRVYLLNPNIL